MKKVKTEEKPATVDTGLVLGYIAVKDIRGTEERVAVLSRLGYDNKSIATICATNENVVRALKSRAKTPRSPK